MKRILLLMTASLAMISSAVAAPVQWSSGSGANNHWYEFVALGAGDPSLTASQAEALAESSSFMGLGGYLATITSAAEQAFLNSAWPGAGSITGQFNGYSFFLIGATDRNTEGNFEWLGGPESGNPLTYTNWSAGEPNNFQQNNGEDYVVAWWQDSLSGSWNDVPDNSDIRGYLVEYSVTPVPVPAALPLLLGGLGLLGLVARRKRGAAEA
ncbi:C-type lectin domain-containing protein [Roseibium sp.]|uniref:C-type lectin domain-containing protein n=1 Tax=Roseibium sp. TaxID=1936156 RepID=UPI003BA9DB31